MTGIDALSGQNRINADLLVDHSVNLDELAPTHFSTATKVILGIFTLGIGAIALAIVEHVSKSHQAALAQDIINLKDELSRLPVNQLHMAMVGGKKVTLEQTQVDGPLWVSFEEGGQVHRIQSNYNPASLVDRLENDMVSHLEFYGRDEAVRILSRESALLPPDEALSTHSSRLRELSLLTLEGTLGYRPADLSTTSTKLLAQFAISAACGHLRTEEDVQYLLDTIGNAQRINDEEVLELLAQLDGEIVASGRESVDRVVRTDVLRAGEPKASSRTSFSTARRTSSTATPSSPANASATRFSRTSTRSRISSRIRRDSNRSPRPFARPWKTSSTPIGRTSPRTSPSLFCQKPRLPSSCAGFSPIPRTP